MGHWTYEASRPAGDLEQGDFLAPTKDLRDLLRKVHPLFDDDKYLGFVVATQSCDLVRRKQAPKARHISIAVVRPLRQAWLRFLAEVASPVGADVFLRSKKAAARQLLERIFDQNEQALGLFYLHPDAEIGLGEPAVACLRITIALRSEHYALLVSARTGRLDPEFRAKFGWLLGNLYSRAAAPDWADSLGGKQSLDALIDGFLNPPSPGGPVWAEDDNVDAAKANGALKALPPEATRDELLAVLTANAPKPSLEALVDEVVKQAAKALVGLNAEIVPSRVQRIAQRATVAAQPTPQDTQVEVPDPLAPGGENLAGADPVASLEAAFLEKLRKRLMHNNVLTTIVRRR